MVPSRESPFLIPPTTAIVTIQKPSEIPRDSDKIRGQKAEKLIRR